ncbi:hypothetical protein Purlil1_3138 [Purpureocillium lilacinum]|uniref:Isochorismatase-like domain-containing protein n=1 Tax=Purpureocillium lilacinum TaxID=33203 RepID=A0ABR0C8H9_PURLI|nr:hypothetical protein Purlil1_3138 [Purpureocillium lilacinum]
MYLYFVKDRIFTCSQLDWKSKVIFHPPGPHNIVLTCLGPETIVKTENGLQDVVMGVYGTGFELAGILRYADTGYFAFEARREPLLVLSELRDHTTAETRARDFDHMYTVDCFEPAADDSGQNPPLPPRHIHAGLIEGFRRGFASVVTALLLTLNRDFRAAAQFLVDSDIKNSHGVAVLGRRTYPEDAGTQLQDEYSVQYTSPTFSLPLHAFVNSFFLLPPHVQSIIETQQVIITHHRHLAVMNSSACRTAIGPLPRSLLPFLLPRRHLSHSGTCNSSRARNAAADAVVVAASTASTPPPGAARLRPRAGAAGARAPAALSPAPPRTIFSPPHLLRNTTRALHAQSIRTMATSPPTEMRFSTWPPLPGDPPSGRDTMGFLDADAGAARNREPRHLVRLYPTSERCTPRSRHRTLPFGCDDCVSRACTRPPDERKMVKTDVHMRSVCDLQEKFRNAIYEFDSIVLSTTKLLNFARALSIPIHATTQTVSKLGPTVPAVAALLPNQPHDKTKFSMLVPQVAAALPPGSRVALVGIESHICITQTALDLRDAGHVPYVLADAVSSCNRAEVIVALDRLRAEPGIIVTTTESWMYESLGDASHPAFKSLFGVVKGSVADTKRVLEALPPTSKM